MPHGDGKNQFGEDDPREMPQSAALPATHSNTALEALSQAARDNTRGRTTAEDIMATSPTLESLVWELNVQGYIFSIEPMIETRLANMGPIRRAKVEYWREFFMQNRIELIQQRPRARDFALASLLLIWRDIVEIDNSGQ